MPAAFHFSLDSFELHIAGLHFGVITTALLVAALATALVSFIELTRSWRRDRLAKRRVADLRGAVVEGRRAVAPSGLARRRGVTWYGRIGAVIAKTPLVGAAEQRRLAEKLTIAGLGGPGRVATLIALRFLFAPCSGLLTWLAIRYFDMFSGAPPMRPLMTFAGIAVGWRLPDLVVGWLARRRRQRLESGFPEALDLMVICAEAGLALEQALDQVARDLRLSTPEVAEEFGITASEMRVIADRSAALQNLATRTGLESLQGMISVLNQSIRFGTPLSEALRQLAAESRTVRMARLEERGARLSVTLLLPIMFFLLPCMFLVVLGPVVIQGIDTFHKLLETIHP